MLKRIPWKDDTTDCKDDRQWNGICGWEREREIYCLVLTQGDHGKMVYWFSTSSQASVSTILILQASMDLNGLEKLSMDLDSHGNSAPKAWSMVQIKRWHDNVVIRHHIVNNWKIPNYSTKIHYWACDLLNLAGFPWSKRSTLIWNDLAQLPINLITFNWSWIASFTGNSGYPNTLASWTPDLQSSTSNLGATRQIYYCHINCSRSSNIMSHDLRPIWIVQVVVLCMVETLSRFQTNGMITNVRLW